MFATRKLESVRTKVSRFNFYLSLDPAAIKSSFKALLFNKVARSKCRRRLGSVDKRTNVASAVNPNKPWPMCLLVIDAQAGTQPDAAMDSRQRVSQWTNLLNYAFQV